MVFVTGKTSQALSVINQLLQAEMLVYFGTITSTVLLNIHKG